MARRHSHTARIVTAFMKIPEELEPGKVRCNGCGKVISLTKNGRTRRHKTPAGEPCAYVVTYAKPIELIERPEIKIRPTPKYTPGRDPAVRGPQGPDPYSRLEAGSECEDCGRWLPGERHVCGRCSNHRKANRRKLKSEGA